MKQEMVLNLYVRIPDQLLVTLLEDGMDLTDVYLLGYLRRGLHGQGYSFQGDRFLAGLLHINPRQIQRHIRKLEDKGYLTARTTSVPWVTGRSTSPPKPKPSSAPSVPAEFSTMGEGALSKTLILLSPSCGSRR